MSSLFIMPKKVVQGNGALEGAKSLIKGLGSKALIVTDESMIKFKNIDFLENILKEQGVPYVIFSGINGEPNDLMIEEGLKAYLDNECDFLIALGGGSPIDSMKAVAALVGNGGKITDYLGKVIEKETPPMVAIPTTAGTGSEATQFTIITDTKRDIKMLLKGAVLMPDLAIIDPRFTLTVPAKVTASTGLDALCHCVEAFTSRKAQPLSDIFAVSAVKRIFEYLPRAYRDGTDIEAREQMSLAALEAGIAFNNSSVTIIHGMSRPIGALFHVAHGTSNAMLIEKCLSFALDAAYDRFARLGREIKVASEEDSDKEAAEKFLKATIDLVHFCEIPSPLEYGISKDDFYTVIDKMSEDAVFSGSPSNTIKEVTVDDVKEIYKSLY